LRRSNPAFFSQAPRLDCFASPQNGLKDQNWLFEK